MAHNQQIGIKGEQQAVEFLRQEGYEILETNWRWKRCEVDIIAQHDGMLIFVEVKTRTSTAFGMPEESVSQAKQDKLAEAAETYIEQINHRGEIRFDIIAIVVSGTKNELLHLKDAFFPS